MGEGAGAPVGAAEPVLRVHVFWHQWGSWTLPSHQPHWPQAQYEEMLEATSAGRLFACTLQLRSPRLRAWLAIGQGHGQGQGLQAAASIRPPSLVRAMTLRAGSRTPEIWHEVQVSGPCLLPCTTSPPQA